MERDNSNDHGSKLMAFMAVTLGKNKFPKAITKNILVFDMLRAKHRFFYVYAREKVGNNIQSAPIFFFLHKKLVTDGNRYGHTLSSRGTGTWARSPFWELRSETWNGNIKGRCSQMQWNANQHRMHKQSQERQSQATMKIRVVCVHTAPCPSVSGQWRRPAKNLVGN
jgi:hypothetical protein